MLDKKWTRASASSRPAGNLPCRQGGGDFFCGRRGVRHSLDYAAEGGKDHPFCWKFRRRDGLIDCILPVEQLKMGGTASISRLSGFSGILIIYRRRVFD